MRYFMDHVTLYTGDKSRGEETITVVSSLLANSLLITRPSSLQYLIESNQANIANGNSRTQRGRFTNWYR